MKIYGVTGWKNSGKIVYEKEVTSTLKQNRRHLKKLTLT